MKKSKREYESAQLMREYLRDEKFSHVKNFRISQYYDDTNGIRLHRLLFNKKSGKKIELIYECVRIKGIGTCPTKLLSKHIL
jgi:hypothetical protein